MATATATVLADWTVALSTDSVKPGTWRRASFDSADVLIAATNQAVDKWPPLNLELVYVWTDEDGSAEASAMVAASQPILSSTMGSGSRAVVVKDQAPLEFEARTVLHDVLYRADPVAAVLPARYPGGTLVLLVRSRTERVALLSLLSSGDPLVLRSTCPDAVDDLTLQPQRWSDPLLNDDVKRGPRLLTIEYQAVSSAPTSYAAPPAWSWDDVEAAYGSWEELEAAYASWHLLEQGPTP